MSTGATQSTRPLAITTPLGDDVLLLNSISGTESLSAPFQYDLEMQSEVDDITPESIVGHNVTIRVEAAAGKTRYINGIVSEFAHIGWADRFTSYRARIVPWVWFLDQTADCRIFQKKSTPEIIEQIFKDSAFTDFQSKLTGSYPPREYCVQYRESDLNFVSRLLADEGIFYFFRHEDGKHTLVLADATSAYFDIADSEVEFPDPTRGFVGANRVTAWEHSYSFRPGKYAHTDYNFKKPSTSLLKSEATKIKFRNMSKFEIYDYQGGHEDGARGQALAKIRLQELEARHDVAQGRSHCGSFTPGGKFTFIEHRSDSEIGKTYALTEVSLQARQDDFTTTDSGTGFEFENSFECIPVAILFRPERPARRPVVEGPQTAVVVGPSGEEIHVDEFSRVKVQFHWDREGERNQNSSCWIRVSQAHAGAGWGYIDIPRIGEEVIVDFIEGNPDRPIITGRVYNGEVTPPFPLDGGNNAKNKTRRGSTTKSYKAGGFNELSMDDTPGKEQIRVHGQFNMDSVIENDLTELIKNDRKRHVLMNETINIDGMRTETVNKDEKLLVKQSRQEEVKINETLTVGGDRERTVKGNETIHITGQRLETVGSSQVETVKFVFEEAVGIAKIDAFGVAHSKTVGAVLNVAVGGASMEEVGLFKGVVAGVRIAHSCGDSSITMKRGEITIACGKSKIILEKGGTIKIDGQKIQLTAPDIGLFASNKLAMQGDTYHLHGKSSGKVTAASMVEVKSGMVKINC